MSDDMNTAIVPKSDQLNSDDLIAAPITITVSGVTIRSGQEQPVSIHYEGDNGKPYKPCKSMSRVLVFGWGADSRNYKGRSMTLYRDPSVKWAGMEVGGIRISHLSHLDSDMTLALTATKGSRKPYVVRRLEAEAIDWKARINEAPSLDALQKIWKSRALPADQRAELEPVKDARKAQLEAGGGQQEGTASGVSFAAVADGIQRAVTPEDLVVVEHLIPQVKDQGQQVELKEAAAARRAELTKAPD